MATFLRGLKIKIPYALSYTFIAMRSH